MFLKLSRIVFRIEKIIYNPVVVLKGFILSILSNLKKSVKVVSFLSSGRGSNFRAVAVKIKKKIKNASLGFLITDNPDAGAIEIAREFGMRVAIVDFGKYKNRRSEFDLKIQKKLIESNSHLIVAAGFTKILSPKTVELFKNRIINVHPALLPSFPGLKAQKQALDYGVKIAGCTIHFIDEGVDTGPIIIQKAIPIEPEISVNLLSRLILKLEHQALPEAVDLFCRDRLIVRGRRVFIKR